MALIKSPPFTVYPAKVETDHTWMELGAILKIVEMFHIDLFIELGIHKGGVLAVLLPQLELYPTFNYYGICLDKNEIEPRLVDVCDELANICLIEGSCFSNALLAKMQNILDTSKGTALVYCNGADPVRELHEYAYMLQPGDIISGYGYPTKIRPEHIKKFSDEDFTLVNQINEPWLAQTKLFFGVIK